ncbi:hypothetical protein CEUSTIGMA_g11243.t1 [Chlamydomonas eustigma]|uniref:Uncharacterized protein n=1 Tax=Chlamydomonas eustigma TaxID=1157962 RepID=A0A250XL60_9CHLO|nr:hypothetical protein CEUSTIGMA_g11243.t1 [Chlamydomonas eustigma]|eukprot:GAX83818.1 hypothetical protein CEUSTIGMA_g11243.t1 [Chlamydomonas eustigma]
MANVANAFEALLGAGEQISSGKKKSKNKSKPKDHVTVTTHTTSAHSTATANGHDVNASTVVDVSEAVAILERAAREARSITEKCRLWKDWVRQGLDKSGKCIKYKLNDESLIDFKQVLLKSKAMEISVESSIVLGLSQEHQEALGQLLSIFLPSSASVAQTLAMYLVRLSALLEREGPDTQGAAKRAVHSVVAAMKTVVSDLISGDSDTASSWLSRISSVDAEISKQQGLLQKLSFANGGVTTKEQLSCAKAVHKLCQEKLDLLQPDHLPVFKSESGAVSSTAKSIKELQEVVQSHLKEAAGLEDSARNKASSMESQRLQSMAAYRREEAILNQEAADVASQIRTFEAQLRALKSRQAELEERRAQLQHQTKAISDAAGSFQPLGGQLSVSHYREELAVIQALDTLLHPDDQASPQHVMEVQQSQSHAPLDFMASGQYYLELALASLGELPNRLTFCKQRISQAEKLLALGAGASGAKKEEAEKLLAEYLKGADDLHKGCMQVVADINQRYDILARGPAAGSAAESLRIIDALHAQVRLAYDHVQASYRAPLVEVVPVPRQQGSRHQSEAANGNGHAAPQEQRSRRQPLNSRPISAAAAAATAPAPTVVPTAAPVASHVAPRPAGPPPKQWSRVQAVDAPAASSSSDAAEPTPAEALRAAGTSEAFKEIPQKKSKKKD